MAAGVKCQQQQCVRLIIYFSCRRDRGAALVGGIDGGVGREQCVKFWCLPSMGGRGGG
jgi:hypothetical protein